MNSSPRMGDLDSHYECSITPTMVFNFNLPNSNVNKNGPYLQITEQPQTKFRFRYQSEMVGTHGQLKAEVSNKTNNVYPTIKLLNWNGGPVLIKLMLHTAEDNVNDRKKHVHQLHGKNCNADGVCEIVVDEKNNYTAQFPNLGIIHIAKRDVSSIICKRKKDELINNAYSVNPGLRNESIQHNISPTQLKQIKQKAEEEAKTMDLNKVVLRFQSFFYDNDIKGYRPISDYVDSGVIFNLKNASTGELRIVRISAVSASCFGGTEVWMLVEKVKKSNVRIKFFELDHEGNEIWKSYGDFKDSDVHHQYAIVFKTPAYHTTSIRDPVHIKVQLERTTDHDTSEPHDFTFTPETLKRSNMFMEQNYEPDYHPPKKVRHSSMEPVPVNLTNSGKSFREPRKNQTYEPPNQSPSQRVPSPINSLADSPASSEVFYPPMNNFSTSPSITVSSSDEYLSPLGENQLNGPKYFTMSSPNGGLSTPGQVSPPYHQGGLYPSASPNQLCTSPKYHQVPSPSSMGQQSPMYITGVASPNYSSSNFGQSLEQTNETALDQIQQFQEVHQEVQKRYNQHQEPLSVPSPMAGSPLSQGGYYSPSHNFRSQGEPEQSFNVGYFIPPQADNQDQMKFTELLNATSTFNCGNDETDLLQELNKEFSFTVTNNMGGDIQVDSTTESKHKPCQKAPEKDCVDSITGQLSTMSMENKGATDPNFNVTMKAVQHLSSYFASPKENVDKLLETYKYLLAIQNKNGDNAIHNAIRNKNLHGFKTVIQQALNLKCCVLFTVQNLSGETPLHLAVKSQQILMVKELMKVPGVNLQSANTEGNSVIHMSANLPSEFLEAILMKPSNGLTQSIKKTINSFNYEGETALHMAVRFGSLENVSLLLKCGAYEHACERKQGANPLHLAVMNGSHDIAKHLIKNTNITVDAGMLNSDTALHIAVQANDVKMCAILMGGKANPRSRNRVKKTSKNVEEEEEEESSDEDDNEEENEEAYCTPIDYAEGNQEILDILREEMV